MYIYIYRNSYCGLVVKTLTSIHEDAGLIPGPTHWVKIWHCCELRCDSDLALLCLWCRPTAAALTRPLAWERTSICHRCGHSPPGKEYIYI